MRRHHITIDSTCETVCMRPMTEHEAREYEALRLAEVRMNAPGCRRPEDRFEHPFRREGTFNDDRFAQQWARGFNEAIKSWRDRQRQHGFGTGYRNPFHPFKGPFGG